MEIPRRAVLRALGVSPMAAPVLAQHLGTMAASGAGLLGRDDNDCEVAGGTENHPRIFRSVSAWWKEFGEEETLQQTRHVTKFDADIISFHLPLQAKVAFQRQRNFERRKEDRLREMGKRILKHGLIKWWA